MTTISESLDRAADVLERDGWAQDEFHVATGDGEVCHCVLGAIGVATGWHRVIEVVTDDFNGERVVDWGFDDDPRGTYNQATSYFADFLKLWYSSRIPKWNDDPERTPEEVVARLRDAAARAEGK